MKRFVSCGVVRLLLEVSGKSSGRVVIMSHGFLSSKNKLFFQRLAGQLARAGIMAVRFNYDTELLGERLIKLDCLINHFASKGYVIGLVGESYGGMLSIIKSGVDSVKSLALINPVYEQELVFNNYLQVKPLMAPVLRSSVTSEFFNYDLRGIIKSLSKPVLIISGGLDSITPPEMLKRLYDDAVGLKRLVVLKDCGHSIWRPYHVSEAVNSIIEWFSKTLSS